MLHYYLSQSKDIKEAQEKHKYAQEGLEPFEKYLKTSIKSRDHRKVEAKWEKMESPYNAELKLVGNLYKHQYSIKKLTIQQDYWNELQKHYKVECNIEEGDFNDDSLYVFDGNGRREKFHIESRIINESIFIKSQKMINIDNVSRVSWCGEDVKLKPFLSVGDSIKVFLRHSNTREITIGQQEHIACLVIKSINKNGECEIDTEEMGEISSILSNPEHYCYVKDSEEFYAEKRDDLDASYKILSDNGYERLIYIEKETKQIPIGFEKIDDWIEYVEIDKKIEISYGQLEFDENRRNGTKIYIEGLSKHLHGQDSINFSHKNMKYKLKKLEENFQIRLLPYEDGKEEEIESPLRYFFDKDIEIQEISADNKRRNCSVKVINRDEFVVELQHHGKSIFPQKDSILKTKPNTMNLTRQKHAICSLLRNPIKEQHTLLKLFMPTEKTEWGNCRASDSSLNYEVLTDENHDGCIEQREFIQKALNTEDFAILEGPPGSGKTTVILELIAQIIKKKQKVLLCGSTHVAIDNVLERLKKKGLIKELGIFPIRVGREDAVSDDIKEYRLGDFDDKDEDSLLKTCHVYNAESVRTIDSGISLDFFMELSNLVCGTTMGILQYPLFKRDEKSQNNIIAPEFDYLIIDECSKTTFQEFLVPALYAKKWILVGDTRQLSPYEDQEEIEENLKTLQLQDNNKKGATLDETIQEACFLLHSLYGSGQYGVFGNLAYEHVRFAIGVPQNILKHIQKECSRPENKNEFGFLKDNDIFKMLEYNIFFYDAESIQKEKIPEVFLVIEPFKPDKFDFTTSQYYAYQAYAKKHKIRYYFDRKNGIDLENFTNQVQKYFSEKTWASEIAWRLKREFECRKFEGKRQIYKKQIESFFPHADNLFPRVRGAVDRIMRISQPSILESLVDGVYGDRKEGSKTTLWKGFSGNLLKDRRTILKFQGRMHPEISHFPRENFYKYDNALQDISNIEQQRLWEYKRYKQRSVWIDVRGKTEQGKNRQEAKRLIEEMKIFIDFVKNRRNSRGEYRNPLNEEWSIAILTFYQAQQKYLASELQKFTGMKHKTVNFDSKFEETNFKIKLATVDKFQGQEADIVFLSMVRTEKVGFLDSLHRINVAITRAKYQLVILGDWDFFSKRYREPMLLDFAKHHEESKMQ